jgi:hypothetical protein
MDIERTIDDIEQLEEMFEAPNIRPLSVSDIAEQESGADWRAVAGVAPAEVQRLSRRRSLSAPNGPKICCAPCTSKVRK